MPLTIGPVEIFTMSHLVDKTEVDVAGKGEAAVVVAGRQRLEMIGA